MATVTALSPDSNTPPPDSLGNKTTNSSFSPPPSTSSIPSSPPSASSPPPSPPPSSPAPSPPFPPPSSPPPSSPPPSSPPTSPPPTKTSPPPASTPSPPPPVRPLPPKRSPSPPPPGGSPPAPPPPISPPPPIGASPPQPSTNTMLPRSPTLDSPPPPVGQTPRSSFVPLPPPPGVSNKSPPPPNKSPASVGSTPSSSSPSSPTSSSYSSSNNTAIIEGVVAAGVLIFVAVIICVTCFTRKRKRKHHFMDTPPGAKDHRAITKTQNSLAVDSHVDLLRACVCRDAPTLLGYEPSYKGKLTKRKKKDKEAGPSTKAKGKKSAAEVGVGDEAQKPSKKVKQPRVKFPTFQKSADFWFQESLPTDFQGIHIPPIRTLIPRFADDMGRRNVVKMSLKEAAAASKKVAAPSPAESPVKRQKVHDFFPARPPTPLTKEKDQTESSAAGGSKSVERAAGSDGRVIISEFTPSFAMADGRVVSVEDSVKEEPGLAVTMLHGLALPKDMDRIPGELHPSLVHTSAYLVQAGQALLRASRQAELLAAERTRYRDEAKAERDNAKAAKNGLRFAKSKVAALEKERDEALENAKTAERELEKVARREKRKMKEVDEKAFQAGYDRAGLEYVREARSMVNEELKKKLPIAYRAGYRDGVKIACGVMQMEPDMNLVKSIPVADVPELVLPYTEEECAPLTPEEFPESDDDVEDMTVADVDGGDGSSGKKDMAVNAEQGIEQVEKNDEVVVETEEDAARLAESAAEGDPPHP